jgi:MFS transporter, PPP family, 3-phenylpropionic acid transporter
MARLAMPRWLWLCGIVAVARLGITAAFGGWFAALVVAQLLHAMSFATHHTTCIALVSRHFPGRLRGRGQALFTVIGYGCGGVLGVLAGGALAQQFGYVVMYAVATGLAGLGTLCAWRVLRLEAASTEVAAV